VLRARSQAGQLSGAEIPAAISAKKRSQWPATLSEQVRAIRAALAEQQGTISAEFLARQFTRARAGRIAEILKTLVALGQAREVEGRYIS
jgi:hypothetical protein